jgi:hypothetical protein
MVIASSGPISFQTIQDEFGGTKPIEIKEYYTDNTSGYTANVSGLPVTGQPYPLNIFYNKSKSSTVQILQQIYTALSPYLAEYKNLNFYEYALDGDTTYIADGYNDMYDSGNYTYINADGTISTNLSYNTTTESSVVVNGKSVNYISLGYSRPLIMLARSSTRAYWGFQKSGNLGADGSGNEINFNVYTGQTVNGFIVHAWCRVVYNASDPSIGDLYFAIGDNTSTFYSSMSTYAPNNTNDGGSSMRIDCVNTLFGCMLLSKPYGEYISNTNCENVLIALTNRLKVIIGASQPTVLADRSLGLIYTALQPVGDYKNVNFYEYSLNGDTTFIADGIGDMYDGGNYTRIYADNSSTSDNLSYNTLTESSVVVNGKSVNYISLGYAHPLIMLAKSSTRALWGFQKNGNLGADGSGIDSNFNVYTGQTVNGFIVHAWCRVVYNASDPSIGDLYFAIGDNSSTFYSSMSTYSPNYTDNGYSSMIIDCVNALFGCMLLSKPGGAYISDVDCQTILIALTNKLKNN